VELITRIGRIVDTVTAMPCARTLAVAPLSDGRTAHLATWLPETATGGPVRMGALGAALAAVHRELAGAPEALLDRPLSFDLTDTPDLWSRARQEWVRGERSWPRINGPQDTWQPIHGDTHNGNYLITTGGAIGLIDFDKMMRASPVFDLARIVDSALFRVSNGHAEFDARGTFELLEAYYAPEPVPAHAVTVLEGFSILVNEATGTLSRVGDSPERALRATALGQWWLDRVGNPDPMGIRARIDHS
ncbi:MAG TPA: phosphotransferase, partial [Mycobacteriales bacterium]|nr:phosphotransferase [Mycobacteriales bacterium]